MVSLISLFHVKRGKGGYREQLEAGTTPLISATNFNNGILDHVDIEPTFEAPAITVERVGGMAFVQLIDFATVPDDITVLEPREEMHLKKLYRIAAHMNLQKWRFNYARKLTATRIESIDIDISDTENCNFDISSLIPEQTEKESIAHNNNYRKFTITEIFDIDRGDFHSLSDLDAGIIPTVSRTSEDNGIVGYYETPEDTRIFGNGVITVSTVTGDAFVQFDDFMATDNVLILSPRSNYRISTLFFIQLMIHLEKWRFSYGRQPYERIFSRTRISLPVIDDEIDEDYIEHLVTNSYGWELVCRNFG